MPILARFRRTRHDPTIPSALYGAIVAQARDPALYTELAVPDTVEGRFEVVVLHTILLLRRLSAGDAGARVVGQAVFDMFCVEMDDALRELGVADTAVPRRMRKLGEAYFGRRAAIEAALDRGDRAALAAVLDRTVYAGGGGVAADALAAYMMAADAALAATLLDRLIGGEVVWPAVPVEVRAENRA
jgi:cytochrome b pre-mRNA-processing protein 3